MRARQWISTWYLPLALVLGVGLAVRVVAVTTYSPSVLQWADAPRFARVPPIGPFDDYSMPAGYAGFLAAIRTVSDELTVAIAVQHLIGLATAGFLYAAARRLGATRGFACVPAAVAALGGDLLFLEHLVMNESLFLFVAAAGLYLGVRGIEKSVARRDRLLWLAAGAAVLVVAGLVRSTALGLVVALLVGMPVAGLRGHELAASASVVTVAALAVLGGYVALASTGKYSGLGDMSGWGLYARVAPTADCRDFDPPAGTRMLCKDVPVAERPASIAYIWDVGSPGRRTFPLPTGNEPLERWALAAIYDDPLTYVKVVVKDVIRYVLPSAGRDRIGGITEEMMSFSWRDPEVERNLQRALAPRYDGLTVRAGGAEFLDTYQEATRLGPLGKLVFIALSLAALVLGRGLVRAGAVIYALAALGLVLAPSLVLAYDIRYGVPPVPLLAVAAALGATALWHRYLAPERHEEARPRDVVALVG